MLKKRYEPQSWESVPCPFCNSDKLKLHEKYGSDLQFTYVQCLNCSLIYQSPRPRYDEAFLKAAYSDYFIFNPEYKITRKEMWVKELKEILRFDSKRSAILDIGSCMGDFLYVAKDNYKLCIGVEISEKMARFTEENLGMEIHVNEFTKVNFSTKFSCIHMSHVIEHIPNPVEWIKKSAEILEEGGILAMSVPNMNSLDRRLKLFLKNIGLRKGKWKENWRTPDHLFEPTIKSTLKFLAENGFEVLEYYTYSRKDMDATSLFGRIYNRRLKQGSNLRFFATPKNIKRVN